MSHPPPVSFPKPWLDYPDQLRRLESRGLLVTDRADAERFLSHVNYYRLSGYCLAFESRRHAFVPGTTFQQLRQAYEFDLAVRDLLSEALEVTEVDLRTATAHHFGQRYGVYGHVDAGTFGPTQRGRHQAWLGKIRGEAGRSKELFVLHFERTYAGFPDLPIWVAMEVVTFGNLSTMIDMMRLDDAAQLSKRYGFKPETLKSFTHHLSYVRNLCAHHSRVWDRVWSVRPALPPKLAGWTRADLAGNDRLGCTLLILYRMLLRCPAVGTFAADWKARVNTLMLTLPAAPRVAEKMGLAPPLTLNPLWRPPA